MRCGEWQEVFIDDFVPVSADSEKVVFTSSRSGNQLCFPLLEKAMAKLYGSYAALAGGNTSETMFDLCGAMMEDVNLDKMDPDQVRTICR
jgi:calpain-3